MRTRTGTAQAVRQALQERGADATRELRDAVQLPSNPNDTAILGTALAEAAAREARRNPQFASEVRRRYEELAALKAPAGAKRQPKALALEPLVVLRHTGADPDPYSPPAPKTLIYVYGQDKLGRALQDYMLDMLKETAAKVQAAHPGTKPRSKASKQAVIDYIVRYSTGG